jgi:hypothetical protein
MSFLSRLLGKTCAHCFSWPRTDADGRYYQICSRCGIAYEYDWNSMRLTDRLIATAANSSSPASLRQGHLTARLPLVR